ncbi:MAG: hypothetical protein ACUZ8E_07660 [Candidatus Anammoxibacter sp.]
MDLNELKDIQEVFDKPKSRCALGLLIAFGMILTFGGGSWMFYVYKNDSNAIKIESLLPIILITTGISLVREAYRDWR